MKIDCVKERKKGWTGDEYGWKGDIMDEEDSFF